MIVPRAHLEGVHVLVVEDDDATRDTLVLFFEEEGARVVAAHSVALARQAMSEQLPDVIVSDIVMPKETGLDFLCELRTTQKLDVRVVGISASVPSLLLHYGGGRGFDAYLPKPFSLDELLQIVLRLTTRRVAPKALRRWPTPT